ncbi:MAG TPA: HPr family phosphocarrier protein, partial [Campylobacterales bacterium]|nr:HPr family phosphocarrier protein [Campylobacterales bacterium]
MNFFKNLLKKQNTLKTTLTITSSNGFHLRPIAKFVNEVKKFDASVNIEAKGQRVIATQVPKILSLSLEKDESFTLVCRGTKAKEASEHLATFFVELMNDDTEVEEVVQEDMTYESDTLRGETIGKGIAIAPLMTLAYDMSDDYDDTVPLIDAINMAINALEDENSEISSAQAQLLQADTFMKLRDEHPNVFQNIIKEEIEKLKNTKFESRIADYKDIQQRVFSFLGITQTIKLPNSPYILVAKELLPSEVNELKNALIQGVILQEGTTTSHASILLRSAAIPSIIIHQEIELSSTAILDASSGNLVLKPNNNDLEKAKARQEAFQEQKLLNFQNRHKPVYNKEGKNVKILANITNLTSSKEAKNQGADGIGLFRTEFLFTEHKPTLEEQMKAYTEVFELFDDITIRTLDIGGDKSLPYINIPKE